MSTKPMVVFARAAGGYWWHVRLVADNGIKREALCGFEPTNRTGHLMPTKGHWIATMTDRPHLNYICQKCASKAALRSPDIQVVYGPEVKAELATRESARR